MIAAVEELIEGTLSISWTNFSELRSTPRYNVLFSRYENFQNGAQRPNPIIGSDVLKNYLVGIGFDAENANDWITKLGEKRGISIPHVMLTEKQIAPYVR